MYCDEPRSIKISTALQAINTMPMNEKTASLIHHFEPIYLVIDDMPQPPRSLLALREGQWVCSSNGAAGGGTDVSSLNLWAA